MKKKYEFYLPGDEPQVMADAIATGSLNATRDFAVQPTQPREAIEQEASEVCEQMKNYTIAKALTNDFPSLLILWTRYYTTGYLDQRNRYLLDSTLYKKDINAVADVGWEQAFLLKSQHAMLMCLQIQVLLTGVGLGHLAKL